jgi:hypothetical protein
MPEGADNGGGHLPEAPYSSQDRHVKNWLWRQGVAMSWTYHCPHCGSGLNPDVSVVLVGERAGIRCLMAFNPHPGDYHVGLPPGIELNEGERWKFSCPVCREDLGTKDAKGLCVLDGVFEEHQRRVYFSPVAGELATYVVTANGEVESFGRDAGKHSLELLRLI